MHVRRMRPKHITTGLFIVTVLLGSSTSVLESSASQVAPGTIACDVPPRTAPEILALLSSQTGDRPVVTLAPSLPPGVRADAVTVAEISSTVQHLEACLNTGDVLRFYALFSNGWFRNLTQTEDLRRELATLATAPPGPRPEGYRETFVGPWHVMRLEEQRVLAAEIWFGSEDDLRLDPSLTKILLFVEHDGRWLIDALIERVFIPECGHSVRAAVVVGPPPGAPLSAPPMSCQEIAHLEKELSKAHFHERQVRAAGGTTFVPAGVRETVTLATPVAE
jgi:hypothetical protein